MGQIEVNVPRLRCIHGRYFWRPTKAVKQLGFANVPLGSDLVKAVQEARRRNDEVERVRRRADDGPVHGSIAHVIKTYREDEAFAQLKPRTRSGYERILREIELRRRRHNGRGDYQKGLEGDL